MRYKVLMATSMKMAVLRSVGDRPFRIAYSFLHKGDDSLP
jgi:hypothetical protein